MLKVINEDNFLEHKKSNCTEVRIFKGDMKSNMASVKAEYHVEPKVVPKKSNGWEGTEGKGKLYNEIESLQKKINAIQNPSATEVAGLIEKWYIDISRRQDEAYDLTGLICSEITNYDSPEVVDLKYLYDYVGKMGVIAGTGDSVNLIEFKAGDTDTFKLILAAIGFKDTLRNRLFNTLMEMARVNKAAVMANVDRRNNQVVGAIVGATYTTKMKQAADATANASYDVKMYQTTLKAIKKLKALLDPQTEEKITTRNMLLLHNSQETMALKRVLNGQLQGSNGNVGVSNLQALDVGSMVEYDKGFFHGKTYGKTVLSSPGVPAGKSYLLVPKEYAFVVNKRPLTLETGTASVLEGGGEEKAWYAVDAPYLKDLLGSSFAGTALADGYGAVIEITWPTV